MRLLSPMEMFRMSEAWNLRSAGASKEDVLAKLASVSVEARAEILKTIPEYLVEPDLVEPDLVEPDLVEPLP